MKSYLLLAAGLALICAADATTSYATTASYNPTSSGGNGRDYSDEKATPSVTPRELSYTMPDVIDMREYRRLPVERLGSAPRVQPLPYRAPTLPALRGSRGREYRSKSAVADEANQR